MVASTVGSVEAYLLNTLMCWLISLVEEVYAAPRMERSEQWEMILESPLLLELMSDMIDEVLCILRCCGGRGIAVANKESGRMCLGLFISHAKGL